MLNLTVPSDENVIDSLGKATIRYVAFFQNLARGDMGEKFVPTATNLSGSGTPTITGRYYKNQGFIDFWIRIVPGTNISGTAGSTYFTLPFNVTQDAPCFAVSGLTGATGMIEASTKRAYPPTFNAVTVPLTITGRVVSQ